MLQLIIMRHNTNSTKGNPRFRVDKTNVGFLVWDDIDNESVDVFDEQIDAQMYCDMSNRFWELHLEH